ncbi:hypothetical protein [Streptomyces qinzhouensis]|uniref:Uncharacterized protein n=1 Tax=Streptomyces qinzhouensis TaxID=2599401 RepID=A0A5B8ILA4_9ACTN|nr:hypothetical protein [Streptomyces qinzhouensis]QDY78259.1 hypothetical protein FQU76_19150 [Streptomyces qinzhouensis]
MHTLWSYLVVIALTGLVTFPALRGQARERAIDRQLRAAATRPTTARPEPVPNHTEVTNTPAGPARTPYTTAA